MAINLSFAQIIVVVLSVAAIIAGVFFITQLGQTKEALNEIPSPLIDKDIKVTVSPQSSQEGTKFIIKADYSLNREQQDLILEAKNGNFSEAITLYDDGNHYDSSASDGIYGGTFDSSGKLKGNYDITSNGETQASFSVFSAGCEPILGKNSKDNINLVVLPDGYTDYEEFKSDAKKLILGTSSVFDTEPFLSNKAKFSVSIVNTNRTLECQAGCSGVPAIICCNNKAVYEEASRCSYDSILVLVKNEDLCGSASDYAKICSKNRLSNLAIMHEFGHSFGDLADEYVYSSVYGSYNIGQIDSVNCADSSCMKWNNLTDGCFQGCTYSDLYRPVEKSSIMYTYYPGFDVVCEEAIKKMINNFESKKSYNQKALPPESRSYFVNLQYDRGNVKIGGVVLKPVEAGVDVRTTNYAAEIKDASGKRLSLTDIYLPIIIYPLPDSETTAIEQKTFESSILLPFNPNSETLEIKRDNKTIARESLAPLSERCGNHVCDSNENHVNCAADCSIKDGFCETGACDPDCPSQANCESAGRNKIIWGVILIVLAVIAILIVVLNMRKKD